MSATIHEFEQGSPEWLAHRMTCLNASEAPVMLGMSPYVQRSELVRNMATGNEREHSQMVLSKFADGHRTEAMARPLAEEIIGEDLFPVVASLPMAGLDRPLGASYDGATMDFSTIFEHKLINASLVASLKAGVIPDLYKPQMEQQMMVLGAERCLFMASDGTKENMYHQWYVSEPVWRARLIPGWKQFAEDVASYQHVEVIPAAKGATMQNLPIPRVQVNGAITVVDDLKPWGDTLRNFIDNLNLKPETDQDFANLENSVKVLQAAQDALKLAEDVALSQATDIDTLRKTVAELFATARDSRLKIEKLVEAEKQNIRARILKDGQDKLAAHVAKLNARLGKPFMPPIPADFAGAMKGKKSLASLRDAVDTTLAKAKIIANEAADAIDINCRVLAAIADEFKPLFPDAAHLVLKASDDLQAVVDSRIAAAKEAAAKRVEEERARAEAAQVKLDVAPAPAAANVVQMAPRPAGATPTLKLGQIGERLGFTLSADFLKGLGFEGVKDRSSLLFHEADFGNICAALVRHVEAIQAKQVA